MKTIDEKGGSGVARTPDEAPKRQAYIDYVRSRKGDDYDGDDDETVFAEMLDYRTKNDDSMNRLSEMMARDPRLAQVISDLANGKRDAASALVRYFGRDVLGAEEGTEEWENIQAAEKERMEELEDMRKKKKDYDVNIEASLPVLEEFGKSKKIDIDEFLDNAYSRIMEPIFSGKYTTELLETLYNAMNYQSDVEDSFHSGVVAGRNQKIEKMRRENRGDGMPRLGASSGVTGSPREKKPVYRSSVWDN